MRLAVVAGVLALIAAPASAQEAGDDWGIVVDEAEKTTLAIVGYSSGQTIAVRCRDGDLDLMISGLPLMEGTVRRVEAVYSDGRAEGGAWFLGGDGSLIISPVPRIDARRLRQGGPLQLSVALGSGPESPLRRYALDLPAQTVNLDRVLEACGADQPHPREDLVRWTQQPGAVDNLWRRLPRPMFPEAAIQLGAGYVVFSCIVAEGGRLTDCRTERESAPRHMGFGQSAMRALPNARVAPAEDGGPQPGMLMIGTIRFQLAL